MANNAPPDPIPLLMTRPRAASEAFVAGLSRLTLSQIDVVYSPVLQIVALTADLGLADVDAVVFTSANGVAHGPDGNGRAAYCVGAATTRAAAARGWTARQCGPTADALVGNLISDPPGQSLIHMSGTHTRGDVATRLTKAGIPTRNIALYDQVLHPLTSLAKSLLMSEKPVIVPLFSPRSAAQFAQQVPDARTVHAIALSNAVAQCLPQASYGSVTVADTPDANAMRSALDVVLSDVRSG